MDGLHVEVTLLNEYATDDDFTTSDEDSISDQWPMCFLLGSAVPCFPQPQLQVFIASTMEELETVLTALGAGIDVMEICGGAARVSQIAVRRRLVAGRNVDVVTGTDLTEPREQTSTMKYVRLQRPLVVVMAPTCTPFGPWCHLNKFLNWDGWVRSYEEAAPHGRLW